MLRRIPLSLVGAFLLAIPSLTSAQACLGLPARAHSTVAIAFEGTDGLSGSSAAFLHGRPGWGLQLRAERYDDQPHWRGPWYGAELQLNRSRAGAGARVCGTAAGRYQHDVSGDARYQRLRWPVGLAWGHPVVARSTTTGAPRLTLTPFVQPQALLQHERWRRSAGVPLRTRTRVAAAATVGLGVGAGPALVRTTVHYATLPEETLNGHFNWFELTMQVGLTF